MLNLNYGQHLSRLISKKANFVIFLPLNQNSFSSSVLILSHPPPGWQKKFRCSSTLPIFQETPDLIRNRGQLISFQAFQANVGQVEQKGKNFRKQKLNFSGLEFVEHNKNEKQH